MTDAYRSTFATAKPEAPECRIFRRAGHGNDAGV